MSMKPCKECPWLKNSLRGYLGPEDPEYFASVFHQDFEYPCHKTKDTPEEEVCTGLVYTRVNSCKSARTPGQLKNKEDSLRGKPNNCFRNIHEFLDYHKS